MSKKTCSKTNFFRGLDKHLAEARLRKTDTGLASDHLPVFMEIRFP
ncbi:MAG: hypothetical protein JEZ12_26570 [Desulfobacterium sp.]|nr:hypothetical protein [Desulfobacterium sp.]